MFCCLDVFDMLCVVAFVFCVQQMAPPATLSRPFRGPWWVFRDPSAIPPRSKPQLLLFDSVSFACVCFYVLLLLLLLSCLFSFLCVFVLFVMCFIVVVRGCCVCGCCCVRFVCRYFCLGVCVCSSCVLLFVAFVIILRLCCYSY